jgi:NAD(P)H-flavin reductase
MFSRVITVVTAAVFVTMLAVQSTYCIYQNMVMGAGLSRAYIIRDGDAITIKLRLSRNIHVKAGQYIGLWIPGVSLLASLQSHPFMVTSWSAGRSKDLDIVVQPRKGWTRCLAELGQANEQRLREKTNGGASIMGRDKFHDKVLTSKLAVFTGPHGCGVAVGEYETVVMIASDFGIASQLPYLDALLYGYNACKTRNRRVHLVWLLEKYSK